MVLHYILWGGIGSMHTIMLMSVSLVWEAFVVEVKLKGFLVALD